MFGYSFNNIIIHVLNATVGYFLCFSNSPHVDLEAFENRTSSDMLNPTRFENFIIRPVDMTHRLFLLSFEIKKMLKIYKSKTES